MNSGWLIAERLLRMGVAFIVSIWIVRYLGAANYGTLAYGLSILMIIDTVATMGIRSMVVRELVEHPDREREVIGTTVAVRLVASVVAVGSVVGVGWALGSDSQTLRVVTVLGLGLPIGSLATLDCSFQASLQSHYAVIVRVTGLALASAVRVALLLMHAPVLAFAAAAALELAIVGVGFAVMYQVIRQPLVGLRFRAPVARRLITLSWPLFVSAIAATVYLKIDQLMLLHVAGPHEVGVYAAAARLSEIWYFLPVAMASSLLPVLVAQRLAGRQAYRRSLQRALDVSAWIAILLACGTTVIAGPLVGLLYGSEFARTADILRIHMWAGPFIFMGTVLGRALIAENRRRFELSRHLTGALVNVLLNLVLIPWLGGIGAAIATLASYSVASYFVCFAFPATRFHARLMSRALIWPLRVWRRGGASKVDLDGSGPDSGPVAGDTRPVPPAVEQTRARRRPVGHGDTHRPRHRSPEGDAVIEGD